MFDQIPKRCWDCTGSRAAGRRIRLSEPNLTWNVTVTTCRHLRRVRHARNQVESTHRARDQLRDALRGLLACVVTYPPLCSRCLRGEQSAVNYALDRQASARANSDSDSLGKPHHDLTRTYRQSRGLWQRAKCGVRRAACPARRRVAAHIGAHRNRATVAWLSPLGPHPCWQMGRCTAQGRLPADLSCIIAENRTAIHWQLWPCLVRPRQT
jgi:hypothetical protein